MELGYTPVTEESISSVLAYENVTASRFKWKTKLDLKDGEEVIKSPVFQVKTRIKDSDHLTKWQIEINPNFVNSEGTRYLSVYAVLVDSSNKEMSNKVTFDVCLVPGKSDPNYAKELGPFVYTKETRRHGIAEFIERYRVTSPQGNPDGFLYFNIVLATWTSISEIDYFSLLFSSNCSRSAEPQAWDDEENSDTELPSDNVVTLIYGDIAYDINQQNLCKLSPVLHSTIKENGITTPIDMSKFCDSGAQFRTLVEFLNGVNIDFKLKRPAQVLRVLKLAHALQIHSLKVFCQNLYFSRMTVKDFADVFEDVMFKNNDGLFDKIGMGIIIEFLISNFEALCQDKKFRESYKRYKEYYDAFIVSHNRG